MAKGIVRVDRLKPRYRILYLTPIVVGLAAGVFPGAYIFFKLMDILDLTSEDFAVVAVGIAAIIIPFILFSSLTVGMLILLGLISTHDGWRLITGRGVPSEWYRW